MLMITLGCFLFLDVESDLTAAYGRKVCDGQHNHYINPSLIHAK